MCPEVHLGATEKGDQFFQELRRTVYTTPKSFLDLLNLFVSALGEKREELASNHKRLSSGITKLKETNVIVQELQETLKKLQPELEIKTEQTKVALEAVKEDTIKASEQEMIVEKETEEVNLQAMEIKYLTD